MDQEGLSEELFAYNTEAFAYAIKSSVADLELKGNKEALGDRKRHPDGQPAQASWLAFLVTPACVASSQRPV